ncbi:MAG: siroheme synthase CysG [Pseudomonadota bacterium]|nr:siroheme synthase CysG [Pseudomonadota bacterium]
MDYLPLFVRINDENCLIVGGGEVAARKCQLLRRAGAKITVISPNACRELTELNNKGHIKLLQSKFSEKLINNFRLVIAATNDQKTNQMIAAESKKKNCLCNVVDNTELSTAIIPAIVDRSPLIIGISSSGKSPILATMIRQNLEKTLHANYGLLADWAGKWRNEVKTRIVSAKERLEFWQTILFSNIADQVLNENIEEADKEIKKRIFNKDLKSEGIGWLVGAGPGDPDLITLKALRCLQNADVIIHDRLVNKVILEHARRDAEIISVGKAAGSPSITQTEINNLLIKKVRSGMRVCRLKGGDPFIFGRGGEELTALKNAGLNFKIIPGITAGIGSAASTGFPLTHRSKATSVTFITAKTASGKGPNWNQLIDKDQTIVVYMSMGKIEDTCQNLISAGRDSNCPAVLIENGTTKNQRSLVSNLKQLPKLARDNSIKNPAILIIGDVVEWARMDIGLDSEQLSPWLEEANSGITLKTVI